MDLENEIKIMTEYTKMMLERGDYHAVWDAAIDLQRLHDKLENNRIDQTTKNVCPCCLCTYNVCCICKQEK